jgi:hypothetical protein
MKRLLSILFLLIVFCSFGQKKRDSLFEFQRVSHGFITEFGGAAADLWSIGYECWYKKKLHGVGFSIGSGLNQYYKKIWDKSRRGLSINTFTGIHYTVGKSIGLRIGVSYNYSIVPDAYEGNFNGDGKPLVYPVTDINAQYNIPGDGIRYWRMNMTFDIGPYFMFFENRFFIYPKFSLGYFHQKRYWYEDNLYSNWWFPYGGITMKINLWK